MPLISESVDSSQKVLIVNNKNTDFVAYLKQVLEKYSINTYFSSKLSTNKESFDLIFILNPGKEIEAYARSITNYVLFFIGDPTKALHTAKRVITKNIKNIRVINLDYETFAGQDLEKILWFIFSDSTEVLLNFRTRYRDDHRNNAKSQKKTAKYITKKMPIRIILISLILFFISIIPLLATSSYFLFRSAKAVKANDNQKAQIFLSYGKIPLNSANFIYKITRPMYLMFSLALIPDNTIDINKRLESIVEKSISLSQNGEIFVSSLFEKNKNRDQINSQSIRIDKITKDIDSLANELVLLNQKIPESKGFFETVKSEVTTLSEDIIKAKAISKDIKEILAYNSEKKYLMLFANNMELRPGGGFIGSFGILTVKDLTIKDIQIYDVYDADGQLKQHINPPDPIRKYLDQPNWFLRDSAFSPDFYENYIQAKKFLNIELGLSEFSGGFLITTTAIQNMLEAINEIYLPDFNEKINKDNFYIKAQLYSEKDFFPGSTQKKSFLASLTRQIFIDIENASVSTLLSALNKSLDEKQIALVFEDENIQGPYDSQYWSGKTISPYCFTDIDNCIVDYIFPYDANLGVNKANFFISKNLNLKIKINDSGSIINELSILINNESQTNIFPGGTYKNYMQIALPRRAIIRNLTRNGVLIEDFDEKVDVMKTIGFLTEIPPQKTVEITIAYSLQNAISDGDGIYQLIFQKQIGSKNSDLNIEFQIPNNIVIQDQNFNPVVKEDTILYNTTLTGDKIFILKLRKN